VLRYWETEFSFLKPKKGRSGQRLYQQKDIEIILEIKRLLYDEKFTIEGVRKRLSRNDPTTKKDTMSLTYEDSLRETVRMMKVRLKDILKLLR